MWSSNLTIFKILLNKYATDKPCSWKNLCKYNIGHSMTMVFVTLQFRSRSDFRKFWQLFRNPKRKNGRSGWEKFRVPSVWLQSFKLLLDIVVSRTFLMDSDFLIWFFAISFLFVCLGIRTDNLVLAELCYSIFYR